MQSDAEIKNYERFYVARQPIFDNNGNTYGYELLFRSGSKKAEAEIDDHDFATMCVATSGFVKSQENINQTKRIFINFTEKLIMEEAPKGLPPTVTVVEILENIKPSYHLMEKVISLKQNGYLIAVDDYDGNVAQKELLDIADIIKVDILGRSNEWITSIFKSLKDKNALKLAEKVDNQEVLNVLKDLGFDLFQGFFFAKPENLTGRKLVSAQASKMRILAKIDDPTLSTDNLVDLIATDPSITYRLLRLLNSAAFGFSITINSVKHAVVLLGIKRLKYWLRMVVMSDLVGEERTPELYLMALNRGKFFEELAESGYIQNVEPDTMFLFGMLSLIDVMLGIPFDRIVDDLPLSQELKTGYVDKNSLFATYLSLIKAVENGSVKDVAELCSATGIKESAVAETSIRSTIWTNRMTQHPF